MSLKNSHTHSHRRSKLQKVLSPVSGQNQHPSKAGGGAPSWGFISILCFTVYFPIMAFKTHQIFGCHRFYAPLKSWYRSKVNFRYLTFPGDLVTDSDLYVSFQFYKIYGIFFKKWECVFLICKKGFWLFALQNYYKNKCGREWTKRKNQKLPDVDNHKDLWVGRTDIITLGKLVMNN